MTTTTFTIDCQTCPVRGRMCADCFVPVLGRSWLGQPQTPPARVPHDRPGPDRGGAGATPRTHPAGSGPTGTGPDRVPLDSDELAAVSAFVRAGLVDPQEAAAATAVLQGAGRYAAG